MTEIKKTAMITLAGRPNVGKSTLLNAIVGEKVAIVTPKPQTTRNRICGIRNRGETQFIFLDTPGLHRAKTRLGDYMVSVVRASIADVDAVASHIPEAVIFELTDCISRKEFNVALSILAELLNDKNSEPIAMLGMLALQMRNLYVARLAYEKNLGASFLLDTGAAKYDFQARKFFQAARGFTLEQLRHAVELCAETDYRMKSSGADDAALFQEAVLRIAAGECDA